MTAIIDIYLPALRRRIRNTLLLGQVLAGLGMGSTLSVGAILATNLSGSEAWSGMAATMSTLGAALTAIPLARLASKFGRRRSLCSGALVAATGAVSTIGASVAGSFPLLLEGLGLTGVGSAVSLQSRFAATDLSEDGTRSKDLSLVVWATTAGAIAGPNLIYPGEVFGVIFGLPPLAGPFLLTFIAQLMAALAYTLGLRPDPLLIAREAELGTSNVVGRTSITVAKDRPRLARLATITIALNQAAMVLVMSMTPVHLTGQGASLTVVGFTISLHVAGMYGLAPLFGALADRLGRLRIMLLGQIILFISLLVTGLGASSDWLVTLGLILLGIGWSSSTVAASSLLTESTSIARKAARQGFSDFLMNFSGALGGAVAGFVLFLVGFRGLSFAAISLVLFVVLRIFLEKNRSG